MKPSHLFRRVSLFTFGTCVIAGSALGDPLPPDPVDGSGGVHLTPGGDSLLRPFVTTVPATRNNVELSSYDGGIVLYSGRDPSSPSNLDGGITLMAAPVSIVLYSTSVNPDAGTFDIWKGSEWGSPTIQPLFRVNGATGNTTFTDSDVSINSGNLSVGGNLSASGTLTAGGSAVITAASAGGVLTGQNFVQLGSGGVLNIASTSSSAITTAGGISVTKDSVINGITVGRGSGNITTNTAVGASSLGSNSQGNYQTAVGTYSLMSNTSGTQNTALGTGTLTSNVSGSFNTAVGAYALYSNTGGSNVAVGNSAFIYKTNGLNSIALGKDAGMLLSDGSNLTFALNSIFIGAFTKGATTGTTGSIVIGGTATSDGPNTTVIGSPATLSTRLEGETKSESLRVSGNTVLEGNVEIVGNTVLGGNTVLEGSVTLTEAQGDISMGDYQ